MADKQQTEEERIAAKKKADDEAKAAADKQVLDEKQNRIPPMLGDGKAATNWMAGLEKSDPNWEEALAQRKQQWADYQKAMSISDNNQIKVSTASLVQSTGD